MRIISSVVALALVMLAAGCAQEPPPKPLLRISDTQFGVDDFREYMSAEHSGVRIPKDRTVLRSYLENFFEQELLAYGAEQAGVVVPRDTVIPGDRKRALIARYLAEEANRTGALNISEEEILRLYKERYVEPRARIKSIYIEDEATARRVHRSVSGRPSRFDSYMEQYNTERTAEDQIGQGVFTRRNMPDWLSEKVFNTRQGGVTELISFSNGYLIVKVEEFLPPKDIDEVREELYGLLVTAKREELRRNLVAELRGKVDVEFNPQVVLEALAGGESEEER